MFQNLINDLDNEYDSFKKSFKTGKVHIATLFWYAKQNGYQAEKIKVSPQPTRLLFRKKLKAQQQNNLLFLGKINALIAS